MFEYTYTSPNNSYKRETLFNEEFRERSRSFFGYKCVLCYGHNRNNAVQHKLSVHHVYYNPDHRMDEKDRLSYVVPLCSRCHSITRTDREFWAELFTWFIEKRCGGEYLMHKSGGFPVQFTPINKITGICDVIYTGEKSLNVPLWVRDYSSSGYAPGWAFWCSPSAKTGQNVDFIPDYTVRVSAGSSSFQETAEKTVLKNLRNIT